jgi:hypothetical protein
VARDINVAGGQGVQIGNSNTQHNFFSTPTAYQPRAQGSATAPGDGAPLRVLVLGASPAGLPPVRADAEARRIEDAVAADRVEVKYVAAAVATDLEKVRDFRPHIVHFVCHGEEDQLAFNDSLGEYDLVRADGIAATLAYYREKRNIRLRAVVLAACDGEKLAPAFTAVADTVIAHRGKLADPCGMAFAGQFYRLVSNAVAALPSGQPPGEAGNIDLADTAAEAAVLTVALSSACAPVRSNLIAAAGG